MKEKKTRRLTDQQLSHRLNRGCPRCGGQLTDKARIRIDDSGRKRYSGSFFGCSAFPACDYYVNLDGVESVRDGDQAPLQEKAA